MRPACHRDCGSSPSTPPARAEVQRRRRHAQLAQLPRPPLGSNDGRLLLNARRCGGCSELLLLLGCQQSMTSPLLMSQLR